MNNSSPPAMAGISDTLKLEAIAQLLRLYTGERPIIKEYDDYADISFTEGQKAILQKQLKAWHDVEPGKIRIDVKSVLFPFYLKKYGPLVAGVIVASLAAGVLVTKAISK